MDKKEQILQSAIELFIANGYKNTNVAKIMKNAGMATGTFYNYYSSKDQIFMKIYLEENTKLKEKIISSVNVDDDPIDVMRTMMYLDYQGMSDNPILKEWYNRDIFSKIEKSYREENGLDHVDFMYDAFVTVIKIWQKNNKMRSDIDAEMIMAIFGALINIDLHKEEIGIQYFPKLLEYLSEFTMKGLTDIK